MHELTEKIEDALSNGGSLGGEETDSIIVQYLKEKAEEIYNYPYSTGALGYIGKLEVNKILGISESSVSDIKGKYSNLPVDSSMVHEGDSKVEKCESTMHEPFELDPRWTYCPICARPAPKAKTLEEKFMEVRAMHKPFSDFIDEIQAHYLAEIARKHFEKC